ncbi:hypothetical protein CHS0354_043137 [Potamilus streckersoni]|uniref:Thioredoxin domain-containing protein n=1 Tax=Potamilus streckersoni TaxID=2493646 RepID=A0AAE0SBS0_9BIVA|nr:hypothetical protein CHS0354_043137 [Potamilus streckersoni]
MSVVELLGSKVQGKEGEVAVESFCGEGKYVGLYFSAHWCPPCRGFTPLLADFYNSIKTSTKAGMLEIVFISSDRDQKSFDEYFAEMPWKALSFSDRGRKETLCGKFGIRGIPTFVLLNAKDGSVEFANARENVMGDPKGEMFPWK